MELYQLVLYGNGITVLVVAFPLELVLLLLFLQHLRLPIMYVQKMVLAIQIAATQL